MKQKTMSLNQMPAGASGSAADSETNQSKIAMVPSPNEIAKWAYYSYVNEGLVPGRQERHWLEAEAPLHARIIDSSRHHPFS